MKIKINYEPKIIKYIASGDFVISRNDDSNVIRRVDRVFTPTIISDEQVLVETTGGKFVSSLSHRMMTNEGYKTIYSIINSEEEVFLVNEKRENVEILNISLIGEKDTTFFDLSIDETHCYYIGKLDSLLLSHNSATVHCPWWHYEIEDIIVLKNNAGTDDNRVRKLDYSIQFCKLFYDRLINNQEITLFSPHEAKGLYEAFGNNKKFEELYLKYENSRSMKFKKKIPARKLAEIFARERLETGRIYSMNIDTANEHGSWNIPCYMSNLCLTGDSVVMVDVDGILCSITLEEVVSLVNSGKNVKILSSNTNGIDSFEEITAASLMNSSAEILEITDLESGFSIQCTPEHKIYTLNKGYVMAKELEETDKLQILG